MTSASEGAALLASGLAAALESWGLEALAASKSLWGICDRAGAVDHLFLRVRLVTCFLFEAFFFFCKNIKREERKGKGDSGT